MIQTRTRKRSSGVIAPFEIESQSGVMRGRVITRERFGKGDTLIRAHDDYASQQIDDPFKGTYLNITGGGAAGSPAQAIQPLYDPYQLMKLPLQNNTLGQCIAAMQTNIEGFGYTLLYNGPEGQEASPDALEEKAWITDLVEHPNPDESLADIRKKARADYETVGHAMFEVGRDENQDVGFIFHAPSYSYRVTKKDAEPVEVEVWISRGGKLQQTKIKKRFRRFIQIVSGNKVYFKEFGDPRSIDPKTGLVNNGLKPNEQACEILWLNRYVPGEVYGLPRYINQLPSILGSREAEMTNLQFFKDNAIPALAVLVSGGLLTEQTVMALENAFRVRGMESMNRVLVLEAQGVSDISTVEGLPNVPKLDIKPLTGERQKDALFLEYDLAGQDKVRSSFRLPPIFLGLTKDYTRATVTASLETADSQVFSPERIEIDRLVNDKLLLRGGKPLRYWRFRSNPAKLVTGDMLLGSLKKFDEVGAMTPNLAIHMANELLDLRIPKIKDDWGNMPFAFVEALILTGKMKPSGIDSLPAGLVPDDANNKGKGGPEINKQKVDTATIRKRTRAATAE